MADEVMQKLREHDQKFTEHGVKLDEHGGILNEHTVMLKEHGVKLSEHDTRFDRIDKQLDFLAMKTLEHDDRLTRIEENMATRADIEKITITLDELVGFARKKDQELVFMSERVSRIEEKVEKLELDVQH